MANTPTTNFEIPKPALGDTLWHDEYYALADTADTQMWNNNRNLRQIGSDFYSAPQPTVLTADTDGTANVSVGVGNTGDFSAGDKVGIFDTDSAETTFTVDSVNPGTGVITMTTTVAANYTTAKNAKIRRIFTKLTDDGVATRNYPIEDSVLFTSILEPTVTGQNKTVSIGGANLQKGDGSYIGLFVNENPGDYITFSGGSVDFATGTVTGGDNITPTDISTNYCTVCIALQEQADGTGKLTVTYGTPDATASGAKTKANRTPAKTRKRTTLDLHLGVPSISPTIAITASVPTELLFSRG